MNAFVTAEMAVWVPEDLPARAAPVPSPETALAALDLQGLRLSAMVVAVAMLSAVAAGVMSAFGTI
ncbi:hypothetical protein AACH06_04885 [Ideonella sp. DXS29W]|uniref:Uncharacterized protein n=1 Tax=Ideonella lacteola TaxID=2984193 RepID=A0ABU9BMJ3_9BURK